MGDECVYERARPMASGGVHIKPRGLVDHKEITILIHDVESNRFTFNRRKFGRGHSDGDFAPLFDPVAGLHYGLTVHAHTSIGDQALKANAAHVCEPPGQNSVKSITG